MLAEMTLLLRDKLLSKDVDWLAWEDPFLLSCDAAHLKIEREHSARETQKRLAYIVPTLRLLTDAMAVAGLQPAPPRARSETGSRNLHSVPGHPTI